MPFWTRRTPGWTWTRCAPCPGGVRLYREKQHGSLLIITHSTRILESLPVDAAHVMENGVIVKNGGAELVDAINEHGFTGLQQ